MWVLPLGRGGDAWWIPVFPLCLSIVGCGIIIYFLGVAGGEHRDAAGFDTDRRRNREICGAVRGSRAQTPAAAVSIIFSRRISVAYRSVSWPLGPTVSRNESKVIVQNA